jgi:hypothetical protein
MSGTGQPGGRTALWRRALVPGEPKPLRDRPDRNQPARVRSAADWLVDSALFAFAVGLGGFALGGLWYSHGEILDDLGLAAGVLACMALWARRDRPTAVLVVVAAAALFSPLALGAALVAVGTAAAHARGRRDLLLVALLTVAGSVIFPLVNPAGGELVQPVFPAFLPGLVAVGLGLFVRDRVR